MTTYAYLNYPSVYKESSGFFVAHINALLQNVFKVRQNKYELVINRWINLCFNIFSNKCLWVQILEKIALLMIEVERIPFVTNCVALNHFLMHNHKCAHALENDLGHHNLWQIEIFFCYRLFLPCDSSLRANMYNQEHLVTMDHNRYIVRIVLRNNTIKLKASIYLNIIIFINFLIIGNTWIRTRCLSNSTTVCY
jgi:hypothetical protein